MTNDTQLCTFRVADLLYGVSVRRVQEVFRYQEMTPVPLAAGAVRGLINLRGQIVTALDMRQILGLPPRQDGQNPMNVVVHDAGEAVSLLVDEIGDVMNVDPAQFEPAPDTLDEHTRDLVIGVYKLDGRLLLALDVGRTLAVSSVG